VDRLARVLVEYSLQVRPEQLVVLQGTSLAEPLLLAVYRRVLDAGANPVVRLSLPGTQEILFTRGNQQQLTRITSLDRLVPEEADAALVVLSEPNTKSLSAADPVRQRLAQMAGRDLMQTFLERSARDELKWCVTMFPTQAYAQDAEMSLADFADFVYAACHVDGADDPLAHWQAVSREQGRLIDWLANKREVHVTGPETDLRLSIAGRTFINAKGDRNMPDGEIFTGPVEDSVEGTVRFSFPAIVQGREVEDVRLWFEGGQVVRATAARNEAFLQEMLDADEGARRLGEFAFGTNTGITRFTRNILFDEKIGGTVHMALGAGYPDSGSQNQSAIHWDMICDLRQGGGVTVDGVPFMRDGRYVV
jgi:aminopeptidase